MSKTTISVVVLITLLVLSLSVISVNALFPNPINATGNLSYVKAVNFTYVANQSVGGNAVKTVAFNVSIKTLGIWQNRTLADNYTYIHTSNPNPSTFNIEVWAWNATGSGNLSNSSVNMSATTLQAKRSAPSMTPISIVVALALWSIILAKVKRRK